MRVVTAALAVGFVLVSGPAVGARQAAVRSPSVSDYHFAATTGLLVFHVHRDRTGDFEGVMHRIHEGLRGTVNPARREQAVGWRIFRARDTPEAAIFVLIVDPVVRDADYDPVKMITEFAPAEAAALYERLRASVARVERLDLDPVADP